MRAFLASLLAAGILACAPAAAGAAECATGTASFLFSGSEECYEVGPGVTALDVVAVGAPGGSSAASPFAGAAGLGGNGARVGGRIAVTPGQVIFVTVGGTGAPGGYSASSPSPGGFNGGGDGAPGGGMGGPSGGGGGGASDLRSCSVLAVSCPQGSSLESRLLIAAGGGGGGAAHGNGSGGRGGAGDAVGVDGEDGPPLAGGLPGYGGEGADDGAGGSAGGSGCSLGPDASAGQFGLGGAGGYQLSGGGGGGGGLYGGGGGGGGCGGAFAGAGGGGGGSSFGPADASIEVDGTGVAAVSITPVVAPAKSTPTAAVPPAQTAVPPAVASLSISGKVPVSGRGRARIAVLCDGPVGASCAGRIQMAMSGDSPGRRVRVGSAAYRLVAGPALKTVPVQLSAEALERLRAAPNHRLGVQLSAPGLSRGVTLKLRARAAGKKG